MKVGIISINMYTTKLNLACPLHTYAFQQFLFQNGIESTIIDYKPMYRLEDNGNPLFNSIKRHDFIAAEHWVSLFYEREQRQNKLNEFAAKYYKKTRKCYTIRNFDELSDEEVFDCFICVTDVIWKRLPHAGFEPVFFLAHDSMKNRKKIAYAAGGGPESYNRWDAKQFVEYISDFDYISVREESMRRFIKANAGLDVPCVLDPVFLQEKSFFEKLAIVPPSEIGRYILVYIVEIDSVSIVKQAVEFAKEHNLKVIEISDYGRNRELTEEVEYSHIYGIGVEEWLGYLLSAEYIFTNSFHGCCLSIIMNKQFFTAPRDGLGKKIPNLLDMFELSWRKLDVNKSAKELREIDYHEVEMLRTGYKKQSTQYILNAIHDLENRGHLPLIPDIKPITEQILTRKWTIDELRVVVKRWVKLHVIEPFAEKRVNRLAKEIYFWNRLIYGR